MAQFIPPIDPEMMEFSSEADLARAMLKHLPDGYVVLHSLPWVYPARDDIDAPAREGEADFIVLHRQYGLLILEVKGGEITLKGRIWYRHVQSGLKEFKDPVKQARRSLWALKKRLNHICGGRVADGTVISVGIAFPHCLFKDDPPADLPAEAIITMNDLASIETAIVRAYRAGGGGKTELSAHEDRPALGGRVGCEIIAMLLMPRVLGRFGTLPVMGASVLLASMRWWICALQHGAAWR